MFGIGGNRWKAGRRPPVWRQPARSERRYNRVVHQPTKSKRPIYWRLIIAGSLLTAAAWLALWSPCFKINSIKIEGNKYSAYFEIKQIAEEVLRQKYWLMPADNFWLFKRGELIKRLHDNFQLTEVKLSLRPQSLLIKVTEKDYNYIWQEGGLFYYINGQGDVILIKDSALPELPLIVNAGDSLLDHRRIAVNPDYLTYAGQLDELLKSNSHGLNARHFAYDATARCVKIKLLAGPVLLFNAAADPVKQLEKLDYLRKNELRDGQVFNAQSYIDLRYGDRVFYR